MLTCLVIFAQVAAVGAFEELRHVTLSSFGVDLKGSVRDEEAVRTNILRREVAAKSLDDERKVTQGFRSGHQVVAPLTSVDNQTPIHLSIAAFMDGERCSRTIARAFEKAQNPRRLSFGVVQARTDKDVDCLAFLRNKRLPELCKVLDPVLQKGESCDSFVLRSIKHKVIDPKEAEGPVHQRSMSRDLIEFDRPDKFCMETDSHMDFIQDWDRLLQDDFASTGNEFAVLTAYPLDVHDYKSAREKFVDCCGYEWEGGIPRGNGCGNYPRSDGMKPILTTLWAAGLSFHRCHAERNVPIDPNLEWIFTGEEVNRATRLWTHGYDLYLPTRGAVLHNYTHASQQFWETAPAHTIAKKEKASKKKLMKLLSLDRVDGIVGAYYRLGRQRTLDQWNSWGKPMEKTPCKDRKMERAPVADRVALIESARHPRALDEVQREASDGEL